MTPIVIFAGTTEGRELGEYMAYHGIAVTMCVATEYGLEVTRSFPQLTVKVGRLNAEQMEDLLYTIKPQHVIDATHPYAKEVSKNIRVAVNAYGCEYLRLVRPEWVPDCETYVMRNTKEAADFLVKQTGKVLLTVGSKELEMFAQNAALKERCTARVLPTIEVIQKCVDLGFSGKQIIAMQGPFTHSLNTATIRSLGIDFLVTKDSGVTGGFYEKLSAVKECGIAMVLIGRTVEKGYTYDEMRRMINQRYQIRDKSPEIFPLVCPISSKKWSDSYFPAFLNIKNKKVLVVGGGSVAMRRVVTLLRFGASICLVAPTAVEELQIMVGEGVIFWKQREYEIEDIKRATLVLAATNKREVNHQVGLDARARDIPVSVADCKEECTFVFPALVQTSNIIAGLVSREGDHKAIKKAAEELREYWGEK